MLKCKLMFFLWLINISTWGHADQVRQEPVSNYGYSGEVIQFVNIAFDDYKVSNGDYFKSVLSQIKYYDFDLELADKYVVVTIKYNVQLLKSDAHLIFKGGGGQYKIDRMQKTIISKVLYK